jgi:hypothetical protein
MDFAERGEKTGRREGTGKEKAREKRCIKDERETKAS